jgi:hypothetical protein
MRRTNLNRRLSWLLIAAALTIVSPGCGNGTLPETPPGASRAAIENPLGTVKAAKQAKVSAKTKAAMEKAATADPRGH